MTTPRLPSAEDFFYERLNEHPYADDVSMMEAYARAVLEAAAEVADSYLVNPAFCCEGIAAAIRALKKDI